MNQHKAYYVSCYFLLIIFLNALIVNNVQIIIEIKLKTIIVARTNKEGINISCNIGIIGLIMKNDAKAIFI